MRSQEITQFTRQLATLLQSGVALLQALDIVINGMPVANKVDTVRLQRAMQAWRTNKPTTGRRNTKACQGFCHWVVDLRSF